MTHTLTATIAPDIFMALYGIALLLTGTLAGWLTKNF